MFGDIFLCLVFSQVSRNFSMSQVLYEFFWFHCLQWSKSVNVALFLSFKIKLIGERDMPDRREWPSLNFHLPTPQSLWVLFPGCFTTRDLSLTILIVDFVHFGAVMNKCETESVCAWLNQETVNQCMRLLLTWQHAVLQETSSTDWRDCGKYRNQQQALVVAASMPYCVIVCAVLLCDWGAGLLTPAPPQTHR